MRCPWCGSEWGEPCPEGGGERCRYDVPRRNRYFWHVLIWFARVILVVAAFGVVKFIVGRFF